MANPLKGCVAYTPENVPIYGYRPSLPAGIVFCVVFTVPTVLHVFQFYPRRTWWLSVFAIGGVGEILGWASRIWAYGCPYNATAFMMQLACLVLAPNFFTAGCYIALGRMITTLGRQYSPISPRLYLYIFCGCDIISLVIQAVGGASAAAAYNSLPPGNTKPGTNIMVGGIVFQLVSITVFLVFFFLVLFKAWRELKHARAVNLVALATVISIMAIYVRCVYRTIELLQGWTGYLITTERYFIALDGAMMVISMAVFNLWNPSTLLGSAPPKHNSTSSSQGELAAKHESEPTQAQDTGGVTEQIILPKEIA